MTEITVLAVTRLSSGVCVAGINEDGEWVRPTRPTAPDWRQLEYADCRDAEGDWVVRKGNVVLMDLIEPIPLGSHSEDWLVGKKKPKLAEELPESEYLGVCKELKEDSTAPIEGTDAKRSLMMVHPARITSFSFDMGTSDKGQLRYTPRCFFRLPDGRLYQRKPVSDAEWRGYGRIQRKEHGGDCRLPGHEVLGELGAEDCWLTLGRNEWGSTIYLMVIGIHLFPPRHFKMDFRR